MTSGADFGKLGPVAIEGDGDLAAVCDEIERLLMQTPARVFQRGGLMVRVIEGGQQVRGLDRDPSAPRIVVFDDVSLAEVITRHVHIVRRNRKTQELLSIDCPRSIAQTILARRKWDFPVLEAVVEHPVMLPDGEILWERGYHKPSGLLLEPPWYAFESPIEAPTEAESRGALETLRWLLEGFDFVDAIDEAVAIAFLMTSFVRPILSTCPAFAIDAHAPGSGKSTLVRVQSRLANGREPAFLTYREDPAELHKLLFAAMLEGDQAVAIDNVTGQVAGAELASILTSPMIKSRLLGQSSTASAPTKALFSFNGNNLQIVGDLTRRVLVTRLDPGCERPAERVFDFDPIREVQDGRSEYVQAALIIMKAYIRLGRRVEVRPFGSFEAWSRLVREPLVWLGMPDPVDSLRVLEKVDPERLQLDAMLQVVHDVFGLAEFKAMGLILAAKAAQRQASFADGHTLTGDQAEALQEALRGVCERNGELSVKSLGRWLLRMQGRVGGGLRFMQSRQTKAGAFWRVHRVE